MWVCGFLFIDPLSLEVTGVEVVQVNWISAIISSYINYKLSIELQLDCFFFLTQVNFALILLEVLGY